MEALKIDYDALTKAADTLSTEGDTFEDCITTMSTVIAGLPDIWVADTCNQYVSDFEDAKKDLKEVRKLIQDMSDQMKKIAQNFRDADVDMKSQMQR